MKRALSALFVLIATLSGSAFAGSLTCSGLMAGLGALEIEKLPDDLLKYRTSEIAGKFWFQVSRMNSQTLRSLEKAVPPKTIGPKAGRVSYGFLQSVLDEVKDSPVVGRDAKPKYAREGCEIGYCFGRATYVHLRLLALGVHPLAIRKAWVVGPQKSGLEGVTWAYHVSTLAYVEGYGWMAVDTNAWKILPVDMWAKSLFAESEDKKPRLYVTDASRFSVVSARYTRALMGLDLSREDDWFRGYFPDMMRSLRSDP